MATRDVERSVTVIRVERFDDAVEVGRAEWIADRVEVMQRLQRMESCPLALHVGAREDDDRVGKWRMIHEVEVWQA
jgi:hypothetical protein